MVYAHGKVTVVDLYNKFRYDRLYYKVRVLSEYQLDVQVIATQFNMIVGHYLVEIDMHTVSLKEIYLQWKEKHVIYVFKRTDDTHADVEVQDLDGKLLKIYNIELRS